MDPTPPLPPSLEYVTSTVPHYIRPVLQLCCGVGKPPVEPGHKDIGQGGVGLALLSYYIQLQKLVLQLGEATLRSGTTLHSPIQQAKVGMNIEMSKVFFSHFHNLRARDLLKKQICYDKY